MHAQHLQHTSVPRPSGEGAHRKAVDFYAGVLGLEEIPTPGSLDHIEVTWFRVGDAEIHVYGIGGDEPVPQGDAHFCLEVDDLDATRRDLQEGGFAIIDADPIPNRPRFYTRDPFGNKIEIARIEGDYLE